MAPAQLDIHETSSTTNIDSPIGQAMERLLTFVCRPSPPARHEFLLEACRLSGLPTCAAVLWLYDSVPSQDMYLLDRLVTLEQTHGTNPISKRDDSTLSRIYCKRDGITNSHSGHEIDLNRLPRLSEWCRAQGFEKSTLFPLSTVGADKQFVGFLQLLTAQEISDSAQGLLAHLAASLTQAITKRRETRLLKLSEELQSASDKSSEDWFHLAADQLRKFADAELCLVYCQQPDLTFRAIAEATLDGSALDLKALIVGSESRVQQIADKKLAVRLRDFSDSDLRKAVFGTTDYDHSHIDQLPPWLTRPLESLAAQPVVVEGHAIAVIVLFNKRTHLARLFSERDQMALTTVAGFLSNAIPAASINAALDALSEVRMADVLGKNTSPDIYNWLATFIPGVAAAGLFRRTSESTDCDSPVVADS